MNIILSITYKYIIFIRFDKYLEIFAKKLSANRKESSKDLKNRIILSNSNRDSTGKTSGNIKKIKYFFYAFDRKARSPTIYCSFDNTKTCQNEYSREN